MRPYETVPKIVHSTLLYDVLPFILIEIVRSTLFYDLPFILIKIMRSTLLYDVLPFILIKILPYQVFRFHQNINDERIVMGNNSKDFEPKQK